MTRDEIERETAALVPQPIAELAHRDPVVRAVVSLALREWWTRDRMLTELAVRLAEQRDIYQRECHRQLSCCATPISVERPR